MNLEKDIFIYFHSIMKKIADNELAYENLTHTEMQILMTLYYMDIKTQEDIVMNLGIHRSNVSRSLKKLENLGYICKHKNMNDKRINNILVTQKGMDIRDKIFLIRTNMRKIFNSSITSDEMNILIKLLEKAEECINENNF